MKQLLLAFVAMLTLTFQSEARTLGFSAGHLDTFNSGLINGLISHAKSIASIEILTEDAGGDSQPQIKQVEKLVAAKVDGLIVMLDHGDLGVQMTNEAARAQEAGKGFAVVAQKVRELAQRSASAAREIEHLVSASSAQVDTGVRVVGESGVSLGQIVEQVRTMSGSQLRLGT